MSFAVAEVQKITANVPQTCGFAVADHLLLFCGICGCGIEFKFAVPSTGATIFSTSKSAAQNAQFNFFAF